MEPGAFRTFIKNPSSPPYATALASALQAGTLPHPHRHPFRQSVNGRHLGHPAMAAATVLPPTSHYHSSSSYSSGYPQQPSNMISPESRRPSDETDSSARQSLPSLSEVFSDTRPAPYTHLRPTLPATTMDSSFQPTVPPLSEVNRRSSPHTSSAYPIRQDHMPAFPDEPRPPFNGRHSLPQITDRHVTPPSRLEVLPPHHHSEPQKPPESHHVNGNYSHHPPSTHSLPPYQPGQLPPGQHPLPPYQLSPRNGSSHGHNHYDHRALPHRHEDHEYDVSRSRFEPPPRPFESWSYQEALGRIGTCSRTVFNFAEAYGRIASEQQSTQPIPTRLPSDREVGEMLSNVEYLKRSIEQVREIILATIQSERAREGSRYRGAYEEDPDAHMYSDSVKPHYMSEVKKRRGRAAPPGRCHSCNRIDTPEWRRGPDGARTLCNACGLHYAKLERKRQLEARSLRPKPDERG